MIDMKKNERNETIGIRKEGMTVSFSILQCQDLPLNKEYEKQGKRVGFNALKIVEQSGGTLN